MDFSWTPEQQRYRARLKAFLADNLPPDWDAESRHDPGSPYVVEFARWFCPALAEAGLLVPHWPVEDGGAGADPWHHWILGEEMFAAGEPRSYQYMNVNWIGPAIITYGTAEQRKRHIPEITQGRVFWCQGFSEPSAGSDLAAMRTRAEPTGNGWRINGQKIWTSAAGCADYCFLLARTGPERHAITVFLVPMNTPGIEVRPIASLTGKNSLNEVFFSDVDVAGDTVLGSVGNGWDVVRTVLHNERIGAPRYMMARRALDRAAVLLSRDGRLDDPEIKGRMGLARPPSMPPRCRPIGSSTDGPRAASRGRKPTWHAMPWSRPTVPWASSLRIVWAIFCFPEKTRPS